MSAIYGCPKQVISVFRVVSLLLVVGMLSACSVVDKITPYKMDIQQGNMVNQEMLAKLKPGMTKSQVRFTMGSPLITDAFHTDRWDYVYRFQKAGKLTEDRHVTLFFEGDTLKQIIKDIAIAAPDAPQEKPAADAAPVADEKGFFSRILEKVGL